MNLIITEMEMLFPKLTRWHANCGQQKEARCKFSPADHRIDYDHQHLYNLPGKTNWNGLKPSSGTTVQ
jgi:hypothetical protein